MAARSAGTSSGFVKYARTPASRNCRIREGITSALSTITGMSRVRDTLREPLAHGAQIEALVDEAGDAAQLLGLPLLPDDLGV
jgi:hypothetical protein